MPELANASCNLVQRPRVSCLVPHTEADIPVSPSCRLIPTVSVGNEPGQHLRHGVTRAGNEIAGKWRHCESYLTPGFKLTLRRRAEGSLGFSSLGHYLQAVSEQPIEVRRKLVSTDTSLSQTGRGRRDERVSYQDGCEADVSEQLFGRHSDIILLLWPPHAEVEAG